jgi:hypothetical protein
MYSHIIAEYRSKQGKFCIKKSPLAQSAGERDKLNICCIYLRTCLPAEALAKADALSTFSHTNPPNSRIELGPSSAPLHPELG